MTSTLPLERRFRALPYAAGPAWPAGAAALSYVIAAGVENMELLQAPLPGAAAAAIRAAYADGALAAALAPRLRMPRAALACAVAGPALALAGIVASAPLVLDGGAGLSDAEVRWAFELQQTLRLLAGPPMALFLLAIGVSQILPGALARLARAVALPLALTPLALVGGTLYAAAMVALGLHALCIWL